MLNTEIKLYPMNGGGYTVAYTHPFTKRRIRERFEAKAPAESRRKDLMAELSKELTDRSDEVLVSDLMIQFLKENPRTDFSRARKLIEDFCETFGNLKIKDVTTDVLRVWFSQLESENNYRPATMFGIRAKVNIFFRFLIAKDVIQTTPTEGIIYLNRLSEGKMKRVLLSTDEIDNLISKAKEYSPGYFYPIFRMFVETAAKTDEIIELKWNALNFKTGTVTFPEREMAAARSIPLSKELLTSLEKLKPTAEVLFPHIAGKKFRKKQLTIALFDFQQYFGIKKKWMYLDLRHSYAWNFLASGGRIGELKDRLGHRSVYTTIEMYGDYRTDSIKSDSPFEEG